MQKLVCTLLTVLFLATTTLAFQPNPCAEEGEGTLLDVTLTDCNNIPCVVIINTNVTVGYLWIPSQNCASATITMVASSVIGDIPIIEAPLNGLIGGTTYRMEQMIVVRDIMAGLNIVVIGKVHCGNRLEICAEVPCQVRRP